MTTGAARRTPEVALQSPGRMYFAGQAPANSTADATDVEDGHLEQDPHARVGASVGSS